MNLRASLLIALLLCAGCASSPQLRLYEGSARTAADVAMITLPEQLEVASINGKQVPGARGMWKTGEKRLEVLPGRYEALVYYRELWQDGDATEVVRSKNAALFVIDAQAGHRYRIDYEHPAHHADATTLAGNFHGWVEDANSGTRLPSQDSGLVFKSGLVAQISGDQVLQPAAPAAQRGTQLQVAPLPTPTPIPTPTGDGNRLSTMKAWWQQATPDERRAFLRWVGDPPP